MSERIPNREKITLYRFLVTLKLSLLKQYMC